MAQVQINQGTQTTIQTVAVGGTETGIVRLDVGVGTVAAEFGGTIRDVSNVAKGTITRIEGGTLGVLGNGTIRSIASYDGPGDTISNGDGGIQAADGNHLKPRVLNYIYNGASWDRLRGDTTNGLDVDVTRLPLGTTKILSTPAGSSVLSHGTLGTAGGSFFATISALSGAGTNHFVTNVDIVMQSGTADVRVLAGTGIQGTGVIAAGKFPEGGGIAKHFQPAFDAGANSVLTYHFVGAGTAFITVNYFKSV